MKTYFGRPQGSSLQKNGKFRFVRLFLCGSYPTVGAGDHTGPQPIDNHYAAKKRLVELIKLHSSFFLPALATVRSRAGVVTGPYGESRDTLYLPDKSEFGNSYVGGK